jgi:hypothetical protein
MALDHAWRHKNYQNAVYAVYCTLVQYRGTKSNRLNRPLVRSDTSNGVIADVSRKRIARSRQG